MRDQIRVDDIERITLWGAPVNAMLAEPIEAKRRPTEAINAKFSLPFTVASAFVHGELSLASFTDAAMRDTRVLALAERVTFISDPDKDVPEAMTHGEIAIELTDGRRMHEDVPAPLGNPASPLGIDRLREKFVDCAARAPRGMDRDEANQVADRILALRGVPALRSELGQIVGAQSSPVPHAQA